MACGHSNDAIFILFRGRERSDSDANLHTISSRLFLTHLNGCHVLCEKLKY